MRRHITWSAMRTASAGVLPQPPEVSTSSPPAPWTATFASLLCLHECFSSSVLTVLAALHCSRAERCVLVLRQGSSGIDTRMTDATVKGAPDQHGNRTVVQAPHSSL
jgi:hypothetical protein